MIGPLSNFHICDSAPPLRDLFDLFHSNAASHKKNHDNYNNQLKGPITRSTDNKSRGGWKKVSEDTFQESVFPSRILRIREKVQKTSGGKKTGKYSYFDSEVNLLLVVLVCRLTSMQNIKHREYSKNMEIVQICHKRLFLKRGRRYLTEKYGNDKKLGGGGCFWKSPTGIEVLLWSSNPVFNVGGGQARGGNEISNLEHKTGKLWPGKKEIMERLGKCFLFTSSITYQRGVPQRCFSLGVLWRNRLVLKGGPHQGREIPKDIPLQGLTNEYKINALWRRDNTGGWAVF